MNNGRSTVEVGAELAVYHRRFCVGEPLGVASVALVIDRCGTWLVVAPLVVGAGVEFKEFQRLVLGQARSYQRTD